MISGSVPRRPFAPDLQYQAFFFPASGLLALPHPPLREREHVEVRECASLRATMMRQCIYISLVKQEQWHTASAGAQSNIARASGGLLLTSVAAQSAFKTDSTTTHTRADELAPSQIIKSDKQSDSEC